MGYRLTADSMNDSHKTSVKMTLTELLWSEWITPFTEVSTSYKSFQEAHSTNLRALKYIARCLDCELDQGFNYLESSLTDM